MVTLEEISSEYPLHWLVWKNNSGQLQESLMERMNDMEKLDTRGRTPLMLAVTLGHVEATRVLLHLGANVMFEDKDGWNVLHEAVATGNPELIKLVLEKRDFSLFSSRLETIPELLRRIDLAPDFYVEMKLDITSWMPFISKMCPTFHFGLYKHGSSVRVDARVADMNGKRESISYIFKHQRDKALAIEINHDTKQVFTEHLHVMTAGELLYLEPTDDAILSLMASPTVTQTLNTDKIRFEREQTGFWRWRADKTELVSGYECKVYSASNVEMVTKTRTDHVGRERATPFLQGTGRESFSYHSLVTPEEYFGKMDLKGRDIGQPKEVKTKTQRFKGSISFCEKYPLSLEEQIMPILDLLAMSSSHFAKLKDFIQLQLPTGFPVKIDFPLYRVLRARITFNNIFGLDEEVSGISRLKMNNRIICIVDDSCFDPPESYTPTRRRSM